MTDGTLKIKGHTLVITSYEASSNSKEKLKGGGKLLLTPSQFRRLTT